MIRKSCHSVSINSALKTINEWMIFLDREFYHSVIHSNNWIWKNSFNLLDYPLRGSKKNFFQLIFWRLRVKLMGYCSYWTSDHKHIGEISLCSVNAHFCIGQMLSGTKNFWRKLETMKLHFKFFLILYSNFVVRWKWPVFPKGRLPFNSLT